MHLYGDFFDKITTIPSNCTVFYQTQKIKMSFLKNYSTNLRKSQCQLLKILTTKIDNYSRKTSKIKIPTSQNHKINSWKV